MSHPLHASRVLYLQMTDSYCKLLVRVPAVLVRPPPIWELVNGSRDLLFRGVSSSSLSINNLLCGSEDLYFPLSDVVCSIVAICSIYHLDRYSEIKSIGHIFLEVVASHESKFIPTSCHPLQAERSCFASFADLCGEPGENFRNHDQQYSFISPFSAYFHIIGSQYVLFVTYKHEASQRCRASQDIVRNIAHNLLMCLL